METERYLGGRKATIDCRQYDDPPILGAAEVVSAQADAVTYGDIYDLNAFC